MEWRRADGEFADDQTIGRDAVRQCQMLFGVDAIQPGTNDGYRLPAAQQCTVVRRAIHPQRQTRYDAQALLGKRFGKLPGIGFALRRGIAAADDGEI